MKLTELEMMPQREQNFFGLVLTVLKEKSLGLKSKFYPYFKLKDSLIRILEDYTPSELMMFQDIEIIKEWKKQTRRAKFVSFKILHLAKQIIGVDIERTEVLNAIKLVRTNAFKTGLPSLCLIPVADLMNHTFTEAKYTFHQGKGFSFSYKNRNLILKDHEVLNCYGNHNNIDLLKNYGFSMLRNPYESVNLHLKSGNIIVLSKSESQAKLGNFCSSKNEITELKDHLLNKLASYKTTLTQDYMLLDLNNQKSTIELFALWYRITKKEIICETLVHLQKKRL
eukprot:snap_masked-scaffold_4-processed-gene-3.13-mRNA-1 protein AED:1.00 eAED:1.00 QI:0/-1/0/0/-1/1/1/0/281